MNVPIIDLKKQYEPLRPKIQEAIQDVLDKGTYILGPEVEKLEKDLADYCNVPYALGTSSGTDSLLLALLTLGIEPGDEVITTPLSFFATAEVIAFLKATPVFVDIDSKTYGIDPSKIERAITPKTKALLPVHIFGQCADMDALLKSAKKHTLPVIEDACQAIGAEYKGRKTCSMGDVGCLSFYPSKNLGTYGDGGMIFLKNESHFIAAREYRTHGEYPKNYQHKKIGMNARLSAIAAAVLNVKLPHIDEWNQKRREKAQTYYALFEENNLLKRITLPYTAPQNTHVYHLYIILSEHKNDLRTYLQKEGIQTGEHFPIPLPHLDCFKNLNYRAGDFPVAEKVCAQSVALPLYPEITLEQQAYVVSKIKTFYQNK